MLNFLWVSKKTLKIQGDKRENMEIDGSRTYNDAIKMGFGEELAQAEKRERMLSMMFRHLTTLGKEALVYVLAVIARCRQSLIFKNL